MFAIVESGGKQHRVQVGDTLSVDHLDVEAGAEITLDRVLMVGGDEPKIGTPLVEGATVKAKVVEHLKGPKVITFKYRRRKRSRRRVGFRASLTKLEILGIDA